MTDETTASPGTETAAPETGVTAETNTTASASATTETKAADGTLLGDSGSVADKPVAAPADWPEDWREKLAGGDEKALNQLKRLNAPTDLWTKARSLEQKLSSGEYKKTTPPPAADAKPEELAAWRKENGIPEKPEDYKIELPDGVVLGEADKPLIESFTKAAHAFNWTPSQVNQAIAWNVAEQGRIAAERAEADHQYKLQAEDALRAEWGPEFTSNLNALKNMMEALPPEAQKNLWDGRLADGTRFGDNIGLLKYFVGIAKELNPIATLMPAGQANMGGVEARLGELKTLIADRQSEYYKGPNSQKLQTEYRDLLEAQVKMKSRAA